MDIYCYINSKDIREYLRSTGYTFNSLETAWLIYQCKSMTINEKHEAWNELIATMPDCRIEKRGLMKPQESLHAFLRKYMELEDKHIADFRKNVKTKNERYVYTFIDNYDRLDQITTSFESLYDLFEDEDPDRTRILCSKIKLDDLQSDLYSNYMILNPQLEVVEIQPNIDNEGEKSIFFGVFDRLWFDFPTPFKKGDIVWDPSKANHRGYCIGPFVITYESLEGAANQRVITSIRENGDNSDMTACGYFVNEDGSIYHEVTNGLMDLEYYKKELTGSQRTLITVSKFVKNEIELDLAMRAYHQIITQGYANDSIPPDQTEEGIVISGIIKNNK